MENRTIKGAVKGRRHLKRSYSGKFVLRIPEALHQTLSLDALAKGCSLNELIQAKLSERSWLSDEIIGKMVEAFDPLAIIQFGSSVRGEQTRDSDIDLLIVLDKSVAIERRLYDRWDQFLGPMRKYSPQFVHPPDFEGSIGGLWLEVALEGQILFERDALVRRSLARIKDLIASGHYIRRWTHGQSYWTEIV